MKPVTRHELFKALDTLTKAFTDSVALTLIEQLDEGETGDQTIRLYNCDGELIQECDGYSVLNAICTVSTDYPYAEYGCFGERLVDYTRLTERMYELMHNALELAGKGVKETRKYAGNIKDRDIEEVMPPYPHIGEFDDGYACWTVHPLDYKELRQLDPFSIFTVTLPKG